MKRTREEGDDEGAVTGGVALLEDVSDPLIPAMREFDPTSLYVLSFASKMWRQRIGKPVLPLQSLLRVVFEQGYARLFVVLFNGKIASLVRARCVSPGTYFYKEDSLLGATSFLSNLIADMDIGIDATDLCLANLSHLFRDDFLRSTEFQLLYLSNAMASDAMHRHDNVAMVRTFFQWMHIYEPNYDKSQYYNVILKLCALPPGKLHSMTLSWFITDALSDDVLYNRNNGYCLLGLLEAMIDAGNGKLLTRFWNDFHVRHGHCHGCDAPAISTLRFITLCAKAWGARESSAGQYFWSEIAPHFRRQLSTDYIEFQRHLLTHFYNANTMNPAVLAEPWNDAFMRRMWELSTAK